MKCKSCNIETKLENNNSERKPTKKPSHLTHNLDSTGHVISKLHDGRSCNIETIYQPILAVTDPPSQRGVRGKAELQRTVHSCRDETRLAVFSVPFPQNKFRTCFFL